jgi:hypothetical protein
VTSLGRVSRLDQVPDFDRLSELDFLLYRQEGVIAIRQALAFMSKATIRHRLDAKRWQRPHRSVLVTQLSALELHGLKGFERDTTHVILPAKRRADRPPLGVRVHRTTRLTRDDVLATTTPPSTNHARSVVDAARWAVSDLEARVLVAASFQQRLVGGDEVRRVLDSLGPVKRRRLIVTTAADAAGGAHSLAELDFLSLSRRVGFPEPTLQQVRHDATGRKRYLDFVYEEYSVHVEIDGSHHLDVRQAWADMSRQNALWIAGERVLRFPAWLVRERPDEVAAQVRAALVAAGWRG